MNTRIVTMLAIVLGIAAFPSVAMAQLVVDDFSTGFYAKTLKSGNDNNFQSGTMVGDSRETSFVACSPTSACKAVNPFLQPNSFAIQTKTKISPNALVFNAGYKSQAYLAVGYGFSTPLDLNLAATYDRLRVNFDGADKFVNFNLTVWSTGGSLYSQLGCNLVDPGNGTSFSVDFPFTDFVPGSGTPGADFSDVTQMQFEFAGAEGPPGGEDFAVTSFQAIPIGAPAGDVTCTGSRSPLRQGK